MDYLGYAIKPDGSMVKEKVTLASAEDIGPGTYEGFQCLSSIINDV
jgi:hypothetical protein